MSPSIHNADWLVSCVEQIKNKDWPAEHHDRCLLIYSDKCECPSFHRLSDCIMSSHVYKMDYFTKKECVDIFSDMHGNLYVCKPLKIVMEDNELQNIVYTKTDGNFAIRPVYYGHARLCKIMGKKPESVVISFVFIQPFVVETGPTEIYRSPQAEKAIWYLGKNFNHIVDYDSKDSNYMFTKDGIRSVDIELTLYHDSTSRRTEEGGIDYEYDGTTVVDGPMALYPFDTQSSEIVSCLMLAMLRPEIIDMPINQRLPLLKIMSAMNILTPESLHIEDKQILRIITYLPLIKEKIARSMGLPRDGEFTVCMISMLSIVISTLPNVFLSMLSMEEIVNTFYLDKPIEEIITQCEIHTSAIDVFIDMLSCVKKPSFGLVKDFKKSLREKASGTNMRLNIKKVPIGGFIGYMMRSFFGEIRCLKNMGTISMPIYDGIDNVISGGWRYYKHDHKHDIKFVSYQQGCSC